MSPLLRHVPRATAVAVVLASMTLLAPAANALPVYTELDSDSNSSDFEDSPADCAGVSNPTPTGSNVPVAENGAGTTSSTSNSGTYTNNDDNTDTISFATAVTGTVKATSVGANPGTLDLVTSGTISATTSKPSSACFVDAYSYVDLDYTFTIAQAGFITVTTKASNGSYGEFAIEDDVNDDRVFGIYGEGNRFSGVTTAYLPAGTYTGYLEGDSSMDTNKAIPSTPTSVSIHAEFDVAGSQTAAPMGKASKYVALPAARSCATDSLDSTVTPKKNKAKKIQQVQLFVNDKLVSKVKKPKKGVVIKAPVGDEDFADLRVVVTEVKKKNGKPGKVTEVAASYAACS